MIDDGTTLRISVKLALDPPAAFDTLVEELALALRGLGIRFDPGVHGSIAEDEVGVGRVVCWEPGARILLEWRPADWAAGGPTEIELCFAPVEGGTRVTLDHRGWGRALGGDAGELAGWFAGEVAAPLLRAATTARFGDWLTDRGARRPAGARARAVYRHPTYHYPNFQVILGELAPTADDYLLEVGCGGGAFLQQALRSGCRAAAVDHNPEMVRLARDVNREAVAVGRLEIHEASADRLPFSDATFTCAAMTGVLGFLPDPVAALAEIRRALVVGGRLVVFGSDPALRGTPAAPEPMASRLRFYSDPELERLGREAGFVDVRVERRDLSGYAREAGVPEAHLALFSGPGAPFLLARKR